MTECKAPNCSLTVRSNKSKKLGGQYCSKHYRQVLKYGELQPDTEREIGYDNKLHPLYNTWVGMRQRCNDPKHINYRYYGGKGIRVCKRWNSFQSFIADMGDKPIGMTLDRIDGDGNYEPTNCMWATGKRQALNQKIRVTNKTGHKNIHISPSGKYVARRFRPSTGVREYVGTFTTLEQAQEAIDTFERVHVTGTKGEHNPMAKLTAEDVTVIRDRIHKGDVQRHIAKDFNVSPALITNIKKGIIW